MFHKKNGKILFKFFDFTHYGKLDKNNKNYYNICYNGLLTIYEIIINELFNNRINLKDNYI